MNIHNLIAEIAESVLPDTAVRMAEVISLEPFAVSVEGFSDALPRGMFFIAPCFTPLLIEGIQVRVSLCDDGRRFRFEEIAEEVET